MKQVFILAVNRIWGPREVVFKYFEQSTRSVEWCRALSRHRGCYSIYMIKEDKGNHSSCKFRDFSTAPGSPIFLHQKKGKDKDNEAFRISRHQRVIFCNPILRSIPITHLSYHLVCYDCVNTNGGAGNQDLLCRGILLLAITNNAEDPKQKSKH